MAMDRRMMAGPPDLAANAAQARIIEANKELSAIQFAQQARKEKAQTAVNFILLPMQTKDGVVRNEPEYDDADVRPSVVKARCAAYEFIADYFSTTSVSESGVPMMERPANDDQIARS